MKDLEQWVITTRRAFHMYPETAFNEIKTSRKIAGILTELGLDVKTGLAGTGVVGVLHGRKPGKTIGLRADMDALPIPEQTNVSYCSKIPGVMHACGHDAHTAVMLGVAKYITEKNLNKTLNGNIKFIFQPAEEGVRGAKAMIEDGVLENPKIDAILACHVCADLEVGQAGLYETISHASSDRFYIKLRSKGGHGARPEKTSDCIVAACFLITQIQTIISRNVAPAEPAVLSVGFIKGGTTENILPAETEIRGTVRTLNEDIRQLIKRRLFEITTSVSQSFGLEEVDYNYADGSPVCKNDPQLVKLLQFAAEEVLGTENVKLLPPRMGGEDFAFFTAQRPGAYLQLGTVNPEKGITHQLHTQLFDIDEDALLTGVKIITKAVERYLK